ncbi:bifunctional 4-hydroxy-2-oxoglutarate aldolase/2-dehydro-3-deoxy-phosphogluconate aldolase [Pasteurellaceae bacterium TAE3-ERU1]|uniref:bifunctional 4-hydroxy-2-oxoglutarate aldolase/2-dehydro-3-deoxy-phosphogluconate aldolase n=1 Tax=Spirabiliibacterium mucosae TaxID=28156 RepID=UPI001AADC9E2|nr:bifunctional 4-hydroxy-2-oxoglutarate aldolase/2-dehydro-3-deoxy-phosphogluconate aldolase [Spirabiliibacterium mucosae]MBE2897306.1 bifunctional 4-hydroxy-2-oxoglutarate aldolase/2-dehydro-3-deoxy-phosphogluconate aldolase [Spirabiliibacterium mucosae]MBV7388677.1 bifunctional 4-hydroxy-2-oxoglutarate aldolase/2-dehydro-3-deoxy-phosphogluconate aldolase [Pasteurellaceae bacterium TAE3-ERU1]
MSWKIQPSDVFSASPVVPVMVIKDLKDAVPMAQALSAGGINVFEITLRSAVALDAIKAISEAMPQALVGAGTVLNAEQYDKAVEAGAKFIISPGASVNLLKHAAASDIPMMPGTATPSEMMTALELGFDHLKFFPAEANGGAPVLKAIAAPLPQLSFCPTGGISPKNVANYLALSCVKTVGGSWMIPNDAVAAGNWDEVTRLSREAVELVNQLRG